MSVYKRFTWGKFTAFIVGIFFMLGGAFMLPDIISSEANTAVAVEADIEIQQVNVTTCQQLLDELDSAKSMPNTPIDIHIRGSFDCDSRITIRENAYVYIDHGSELRINKGNHPGIAIQGGLFISGAINTSNNVRAEGDGFVILDTSGKVKGNSDLLKSINLIDRKTCWVVTLDANGGEINGKLMDTFCITKNPSPAFLQKPNDPIWSGYTFLGWYSEDGGINPTTFPATISKDTIYTAKWSNAVSYDINYVDVDGATHSNPSTYNIEDTPISLADATKPGYIFVEWQDEEGNVITKIAEGTTGNRTIAAIWTAIDYVVTYDTNGGIGTFIDNNMYNINDEVTVLNGELALDGFIFHGWLYDNTTFYAAGEIFTMPAADVVLVAQWSPRSDLSYEVKYIDENGKDLKPVQIRIGKTFGVTYTEDAPEIDGYYVDEDQKSILMTMDAGENTIIFNYAKRTDLSYKVEYREDSNAGVELEGSKTVSGRTFGETYNETALDIDGYTVDATGKSVTITTSENTIIFVYTKRANLSYATHYVDSEGNMLRPTKTVNDRTFGETCTEDAPEIDGYNVDKVTKTITITTGDNAITFVYTIKTHAVTFVDHDGSVIKIESVNHGSSAIAPANPTRSEYTFTSWDIDFSKVTGNLTVTALYEVTPTPIIPTPYVPIPAIDEPEEELPEEDAPDINGVETIIRDKSSVKGDSTDEDGKSWALANLILAIIAAIVGLVSIVGFFTKDKDEERRGLLRTLTLLSGAGAVIAFFMLEDMSLPMAFVNIWTILMVAIAALGIIFAVFAMSDNNKKSESTKNKH